MAFPNEVSPKKGRKELTDDRRPGSAGDAPVEAGHKHGVEDDVGHGPDSRYAHPQDGLSGNADKVAKNLAKSLKEAAQGHDAVISEGVFISRFGNAEHR